MIYQGKEEALEVLKRLKQRADNNTDVVTIAVQEIIENVRQYGDVALETYAKNFDRTDYRKTPLRVTEEEIDAAYGLCSEAMVDALRTAIKIIQEFHRPQIDQGYEIQSDGKYLAQVVRPMDSAGIYAPGGKAAYPSSVLMNAVPAKLAGVKRVCLATPANCGTIPPLTLIAAREAGVDEIYRMGGAQAVAAFAYGTQSVQPVDIITGPGNIYVAMAKKEVFGVCGIDAIAGPSEILIIADAYANPRYIAADMLSQAEHDQLAASICVTTSLEFAKKIETEVIRQIAELPRREIAGASIDNYGAIVVLENIQSCCEFANQVAPEHLELLTQDPKALLPQIKNAGGVFLGEYAPEPLGDYLAGTNHVLPTGGTARFASPLGVYDYMKRMSVLQYDRKALEEVYQKVACFADAEGLDAHGRACAIRFEEEN